MTAALSLPPPPPKEETKMTTQPTTDQHADASDEPEYTCYHSNFRVCLECLYTHADPNPDRRPMPPYRSAGEGYQLPWPRPNEGRHYPYPSDTRPNAAAPNAPLT